MTNSLRLSFKNRFLTYHFLAVAAFLALFAGPLSAVAANESILLSATPLSGQAPLTVTFTVTPSNLPSCGNTITKNFGDGPGLSLSDYCAQSSTATLGASTYNHTYNNPGTYLATIKINQTTSNTVSIVVTAPAAANPVATAPSGVTSSNEAAAVLQVQAQISALQAQLNSLIAAKTASGGGAALGGGNTLSSNLSVGASGSNATALQTFLTAMGYYSGPITGYFGPLTKRAVVQFQQANSLPTTGYVGPLTRAAIQRSTLPTSSATKSILLSAKPTSGVAPLTITFMATLLDYPSCGNTYVWDFGDGSAGPALAESCAPPITILPSRTIVASHTYQSIGTYRAKVTIDGVVSNLFTITVSSY